MAGIYYNEWDSFAADWLRKLIKRGAIPAGDVDGRSITDVNPEDLKSYHQCHFFAGIGGWALALKNVGWGNTPVWTGSCPCQPFSSAGKRKGFKDERHLWPSFFNLIQECKPPVVFGEQVATAIGGGWLDVVFADLEAENYACGAAVLGAHSVGGPHIRQRLYWVGNRVNGGQISHQQSQGQRRIVGGAGPHGIGVPNATSTGPQRPARAGVPEQTRDAIKQGKGNRKESETGGGLADCGVAGGRDNKASTKCESFWKECEWLSFRDGKRRPVEPGTFPLAYGIPQRVGRLRGYGNALCVPTAEAFVTAYWGAENVQG